MYEMKYFLLLNVIVVFIKSCMKHFLIEDHSMCDRILYEVSMLLLMIVDTGFGMTLSDGSA